MMKIEISLSSLSPTSLLDIRMIVRFTRGRGAKSASYLETDSNVLEETYAETFVSSIGDCDNGWH